MSHSCYLWKWPLTQGANEGMASLGGNKRLTWKIPFCQSLDRKMNMKQDHSYDNTDEDN
jgi:hypothetical protein